MSLSPSLYDRRLVGEIPLLAPPRTPDGSPHKSDHFHRRSPGKHLRSAKPTINYDELGRIANSSSSTIAEKELATRVVRAAEKLKEWCIEIEQWGWGGSFDKSEDLVSSDPFEIQNLSASISQGEIEDREARLDSIEIELQDLGTDDLKQQILGIHSSRSRPSSVYSSDSLSNIQLYDDFQLFVTEALMYALPYQAKLSHYMQTWQTRYDVFQYIPTYLSELKLLNELLKDAYAGLNHVFVPENDHSELRGHMEALQMAQGALKAKVSHLGSTLDSMLDLLEGHDDRLPDSWIDRFEMCEKDYVEWSVKVDQKLFEFKLLESAAPDERAESATSAESHRAESVETPAEPLLYLQTAEPSSIETPRPAPSEKSASASDTEEEPVIAEATRRPVEAVLRRASVASIESFTRDQVKNVDLSSRRTSAASATGLHQQSSRQSLDRLSRSPSSEQSARILNTKAGSPLAVDASDGLDADAANLPTLPHFRTSDMETPEMIRTIDSSITSNDSVDFDDSSILEESPSMRAKQTLRSIKPPPLNIAMTKKRSTNGVKVFSDETLTLQCDSELKDESTDASRSHRSPRESMSPNSPAMPLDQQISSILDSIPTGIQLRPRAKTPAPNVRSKSRSRRAAASTLSTKSARSRSASGSGAATPSLGSTRPTITLAPADEPGPRRASANDPEIKIYHLLSGNDKPLKLFIRRVGENGERVMVRVGGGWADLAEYLKSYAEHHGHRTASEGKVEVFGLPLGNDRSSTPTPGSGRHRSESRSESRSASSLGHRVDSRPFQRPPSRLSSLDLCSVADTPGSTSNGMAVTTSTPASRTASSALSSEAATPASASSLMGPAAVRRGSEISGEKQEWVDKVVEQAKLVGKQVDISDMGKAGGTRRVFLKGRAVSGAGKTNGDQKGTL